MGYKGKIVVGVGMVFVSPHNHVLSRSFSLTQSCFNNVAEYNALLIGLQLLNKSGYNTLKPEVTAN